MINSKNNAVRYSGETSVWLRRFTKLVAAWAVFLLFAGAQVTSTGSGLAVPDWPLSYGMLFPPMIGGIFYEHGHRIVAGVFGILTLIQAFWLRKPLGWALFGTTVVQALIGGLTVKLLLPKPVSISHALVAEIAFALAVAIAFFASRFYRDLRGVERGAAPIATTNALVAIVFLQIFAGAMVRHFGAGLAIPDFPLSFGRIVPPLAELPVVINFIHRCGAVVVLAASVATFVRLRRYAAHHPLRQLATLLLVVVAMQIFLGGATIWSGRRPMITSLHVVTGAATFALSLVLALTARTVGWRSSRKQPGSLLGSEVAA
ncbi:MAG: COX15/CtaA family protein [Acidobacteriota bacterium]